MRVFSMLLSSVLDLPFQLSISDCLVVDLLRILLVHDPSMLMILTLFAWFLIVWFVLVMYYPAASEYVDVVEL